MRLFYRGVSYEYNLPSVEITEGEIAGKYRGAHWRFQKLKEVPVPKPSFELKYRGVSYKTNTAFPDVEGREDNTVRVIPQAVPQNY